MTYKELHEILDNKDKKLTKEELQSVIYKLKSDTLAESQKYIDSITKNDKQGISQYGFYMGESNAFQIALDLLEHLYIKEGD